MGKEFLGRGWRYPVEVDASTGRIKTSSFEEDIQESINIILSTSKGERIMRSDFGSNILDFVFENTDATTLNRLKAHVQHAIMIWEPRVKEVNVSIKKDRDKESKLLMDISYVVRKTNNMFNFVYPFYINEGTKF